MKNTTNVFLDGLTTDMHPLTTKNNLLTDALNATLRTFNGNELVLQNDMGNTMIQDSTTGNIMGLQDGFIPIGMKEYGGILYIASLNLNYKEKDGTVHSVGQLGTIPSPVINYDYPLTSYKCNFDDVKLTNIDDEDHRSSSLISIKLPKYLNTPFQISDNRFQVGDQFIVCLNLNNHTETIRKVNLGNQTKNVSSFIETETLSQERTNISGPNFLNVIYPLISGFSDANSEITGDIPNYGWFKVVLEAKVEKSSDTITLRNISDKRQTYYLEDKLDPQPSPYWFINVGELVEDAENLNLDTERCQADDQYRTYPNILPGYLYIHIEPELPENFEFFVNDSTGIKSPNVYLITRPEDSNEEEL